jgi:hypothetical protein
MSDQKQEHLRIRDSKTGLAYEYALGQASLSAGLAILIHSFWHPFDATSYIIAVLLLIVGGFLIYKTVEEAADKYHSLTQGLIQMQRV